MGCLPFRKYASWVKITHLGVSWLHQYATQSESEQSFLSLLTLCLCGFSCTKSPTHPHAQRTNLLCSTWFPLEVQWQLKSFILVVLLQTNTLTVVSTSGNYEKWQGVFCLGIWMAMQYIIFNRLTLQNDNGTRQKCGKALHYVREFWGARLAKEFGAHPNLD